MIRTFDKPEGIFQIAGELAIGLRNEKVIMRNNGFSM